MHVPLLRLMFHKKSIVKTGNHILWGVCQIGKLEKPIFIPEKMGFKLGYEF
jgi:hypothetical protein